MKSERWEECEIAVYEDLCYEAAKQNDEYRDNLLETGDEILIEGVNGEYKWGSGMGLRATSCTLIEKIPGENRMGFVHMHVRKRLIDEQAGENWEDADECSNDMRMTHKQHERPAKCEEEKLNGMQGGQVDEEGDDEGDFVFPKKSTPKSKATLQELEIDLDNKFDMYCSTNGNAIHTNEDDFLDDDHSKSFGRPMGRGLGRGKRGRPLSSPGASSANPSPKQARTGPSPPGKDKLGSLPSNKNPDTMTSDAVLLSTPTYFTPLKSDQIDENYDETNSPEDW